nr:hypothetical protein BaRGS_031397 [Batillaria attramentaria]
MRRRGDRYADNCVVENNAWGGPSLMLWGAIGHNQVLGPVIFQCLGPGRGNGITAQRYSSIGWSQGPQLSLNLTGRPAGLGQHSQGSQQHVGKALWKLLRHYGVPGKIISLIQCTYQDMSCRIAHAGQLSESFEVKTGVRQGCLLSPFLFLLVIDWIMKTTTAGRKNGIQWTLWTQLDDLDFADDLALLSHSHSQMQDKTTCLEATSAGTGLKINRKKTELMKINTTANTPVTVGGEPIREVESFVYLGSVVDGQGGTDRDVTARIGKARAAMVMLKNVWASKVVSIRTKLRIFNSNVKSEATIQHHTPSPDMEPAGEKEERPASQQLEAGH